LTVSHVCVCNIVLSTLRNVIILLLLIIVASKVVPSGNMLSIKSENISVWTYFYKYVMFDSFWRSEFFFWYFFILPFLCNNYISPRTILIFSGLGTRKAVDQRGRWPKRPYQRGRNPKRPQVSWLLICFWCLIFYDKKPSHAIL